MTLLVRFSSFFSFADNSLFLQHVKLITDAYVRMWGEGEVGVCAHVEKKYVVFMLPFYDDCSQLLLVPCQL